MKFLQRFYKWSILILLPLLMAVSFRGCSIFNLFYFLYCTNSFNVEYNDVTIYDLEGFGEQYIFVSDNGDLVDECFPSLFTETIEPKTTQNLNAVRLFEDLNLIIVTGDSGIIVRADDDPSLINRWDLITTPTTNNLNELCKLGSLIFAVGDAGTVIKSSDEGLTWELVNFPFNNDLSSCYSTSTGEIVCTGSNYVIYRSTDNGGTWEQIGIGDKLHLFDKFTEGGGAQRIYYFDDNISYLVGNSGVAIRTEDDWSTYAYQNTSTFEKLTDVFFIRIQA